MDSNEKVLLGKASRQQCDAMSQYLSRHGIEIVTIHNKITCTSGCSTELEIWANPTDVAHIGTLLNDLYHKEMGDSGYDTSLLNSVYDPNASEATCPACATVFSTDHQECPDCGLAFSTPQTKKFNCSSGKC